MKTLKILNQDYNLELNKIIRTIKTQKPRVVLIQLPDGLKQYSITIIDYLKEKFPKTKFKIWLGTCFGACDIPQTDSDLIIQFGHSPW